MTRLVLQNLVWEPISSGFDSCYQGVNFYSHFLPSVYFLAFLGRFIETRVVGAKGLTFAQRFDKINCFSF